MASKGEKAKVGAKEASVIREAGVIPDGHTDEVVLNHDGEDHLYFINPDTLGESRSGDAGRVMVLDDKGRERGIPLDWLEGI